jgi:acyl CoA:acetate/3-ketoacid CoA transferase
VRQTVAISILLFVEVVNMTLKPVISPRAAASLIRDEAAISVSASSGLGCPDAILQAVGVRFVAEGEPRALTALHPIAAGDMYGIGGIDHLAHSGLLKRVIAGSFPSGPSSLPSPKIWRMINGNEVEAYNIPSGIMFEMHNQAAVGGPGVLTHVGLDTYVDPRQLGGRMNQRTREDIVRVVVFDGNVNVSRLSALPHVTAGVGGFADITASAQRMVFSGFFTASGLELALGDGGIRVVQEGRVRKFVQQVEHVTLSGRRVRHMGREAMFITERCVMRLDPDGLTIVEIAPGIDLERDVLEQVGFSLCVDPMLREMDGRIFQPQPMGLTLGE